MRDRHRLPIDNDTRFKCFGCVHVRTATLGLGVYHFTIQLFCVGVLTIAMLRPQLFMNYNDKYMVIDAETVDKVERQPISIVPVENDDQTLRDRHLASQKRFNLNQDTDMGPRLPERPLMHYGELRDGIARRFRDGDAHLALALVLGMITVTLLLIYGVTKRRPIYLLPFFCYQVFDFVLACLTAVGHYQWLPQIQSALEDDTNRQHISHASAQWFALFVLMFCVGVLFMKAYMIGVVWSCYQYTLLANALCVRYTLTIQNSQPNAVLDNLNLLPPDYEAATKLPPGYDEPPPPKYETV